MKEVTAAAEEGHSVDKPNIDKNSVGKRQDERERKKGQ